MYVTSSFPELNLICAFSILSYSEGLPGTLDIRKSDIQRLCLGKYLNDTLIEIGLRQVFGSRPTNNLHLTD